MRRWRRTTACERASQWISLDLDGELNGSSGRRLHGILGGAAVSRLRRRSSGFTFLMRAAPPVAPDRRLRPGTGDQAAGRRPPEASALVAAVGVFGRSRLPGTGGPPPSSLSSDRGAAGVRPGASPGRAAFCEATPPRRLLRSPGARFYRRAFGGGFTALRFTEGKLHLCPPPSSLAQETHGPERQPRTAADIGKLIEIKGVVVDAVFPDSCPRSTRRSRSPGPTAAA